MDLAGGAGRDPGGVGELTRSANLGSSQATYRRSSFLLALRIWTHVFLRVCWGSIYHVSAIFWTRSLSAMHRILTRFFNLPSSSAVNVV